MSPSESIPMLPVGERPRQTIDPIALLKREHEVILDQLCRIDILLGPGPEEVAETGGRVLAERARAALLQLLGFFTDRMGVHYERERILIAALVRALGAKQAQRERLEDLEREHLSLQAEAGRLLRLLHDNRIGQAPSAEADPARIRSFVRHFGWHLYWEERILFVLAETRLTAKQKVQVGCSMLQV